ncbi:MAG: cupin domain-containing protein [Chloroflexota bacterium]
MPRPTAAQLIAHFGLEELPGEGGFFCQTYQAAQKIPAGALPDRYPGEKPFSTAIYYLITPAEDGFSAIHKLPTAEVFHFYLGDPVETLLLFPGGDSRRVVLGRDVLNQQSVQHVVPRDVWQGSRLLPGGEYALLGTTMAPGYTDEDFILGQRDHLLEEFPDQAALIHALTRV